MQRLPGSNYWLCLHRLPCPWCKNLHPTATQPAASAHLPNLAPRPSNPEEYIFPCREPCQPSMRPPVPMLAHKFSYLAPRTVCLSVHQLQHERCRAGATSHLTSISARGCSGALQSLLCLLLLLLSPTRCSSIRLCTAGCCAPALIPDGRSCLCFEEDNNHSIRLQKPRCLHHRRQPGTHCTPRARQCVLGASRRPGHPPWSGPARAAAAGGPTLAVHKYA